MGKNSGEFPINVAAEGHQAKRVTTSLGLWGSFPDAAFIFSKCFYLFLCLVFTEVR